MREVTRDAREKFAETHCRITVWPKETRARRCNEPVVKDGLCLRHLGDRSRLSRSAS